VFFGAALFGVSAAILSGIAAAVAAWAGIWIFVICPILFRLASPQRAQASLTPEAGSKPVRKVIAIVLGLVTLLLLLVLMLVVT
jgi:hypothetical protein